MRRSRCSIPVIMAMLTAGSLFAGAPTPASAAEYGPFHLDDFSQTASWSGELPNSPPVLPEACVSLPDVCDIVKVDVELSEDWMAQPGGMLVAIQPRVRDVNTFDLYVYDDAGKEVAKANSQWSAGNHAVWVENPANGLYTVVVAPELIVPGNPPAEYDGFISFDRGLTVKREELKDGMDYTQKFVAFGLGSSPEPAVELLPDLVPTTPRNFHIASGACAAPLVSPSLCSPTGGERQPSCYPEEMAGAMSHQPNPDPPLRCLRFDQGEENVGDGPLELHIYPGQGTEVYQRIYKSDGNVDQCELGQAEFHANHGHFHYTGGGDTECSSGAAGGPGGWWDIKLYKRLPNGEPDRDAGPVASSPAKGVCPLDTTNARFGQRQGGPQGYGNDDHATCSVPNQQDQHDPTFPNEPYIQAGVSVGWADIYGWYVIDTYIDITDVPDGKYIIVTKEDPGQSLREKSTANNTAMACVEISGLAAKACDVPDLQVRSLSTANTKGVREGEKVTISATVANTGEGEAAASATELLLDGTRLPGGLLETPALAPGESATLSLNWDTRGVKGEHTLRATADSARAIEESAEDNNEREITVMVRGNKIRNPSFEQSSEGSSPEDWSSSGPTGYESGGSDGVRSVSTEPGGSWTSEAVPIEAGVFYDVSVVAAGAGGTLLVQQLAADGSVLYGAAQPLLPTNAFTLTSLHLTAVTGATQARIVLLGGLSGTTSFDDVGLFGG